MWLFTTSLLFLAIFCGLLSNRPATPRVSRSLGPKNVIWVKSSASLLSDQATEEGWFPATRLEHYGTVCVSPTSAEKDQGFFSRVLSLNLFTHREPWLEGLLLQVTPQMQGLDVPQKNITVLQPSNFSVRLVTQCLAEKRLAVVRLMDGEETGVRKRKRVGGAGFGGKKVGRQLSLEQEKLTQISDSEDEIRCWVKSKPPQRWAGLPWLVRVNDPSVFGARSLPQEDSPGVAAAGNRTCRPLWAAPEP